MAGLDPPWKLLLEPRNTPRPSHEVRLSSEASHSPAAEFSHSLCHGPQGRGNSMQSLGDPAHLQGPGPVPLAPGDDIGPSRRPRGPF